MGDFSLEAQESYHIPWISALTTVWVIQNNYYALRPLHLDNQLCIGW